MDRVSDALADVVVTSSADDDHTVTSVDVVPDSLLRRVFGCLPASDLPTVSAVCTRWRQVCWSTPLLPAWHEVLPAHVTRWRHVPRAVVDRCILTLPSDDLLRGPDFEGTWDWMSYARSRFLRSQTLRTWDGEGGLNTLTEVAFRPSFNGFLSTLLRAETQVLELLRNHHSEQFWPLQVVRVDTVRLPGRQKVCCVDGILSFKQDFHFLQCLINYGAPHARLRYALAHGSLFGMSADTDVYQTQGRFINADLSTALLVLTTNHARAMLAMPGRDIRFPVAGGALDHGSQMFVAYVDRLARIRLRSNITLCMWYRVAWVDKAAEGRELVDGPFPSDYCRIWDRNFVTEEILRRAAERGLLLASADGDVELVDGVSTVCVGRCLMFNVLDRASVPWEYSVAAEAGVFCHLSLIDLPGLAQQLGLPDSFFRDRYISRVNDDLSTAR